MILKNGLHVNGVNGLLNISCRCLQSQVKTRPLPVNDLQIINPEERKSLINDVQSKLSSFSDRNKFSSPDVSNIQIPKSFFAVVKNSSNIKYSFTIDDSVAKKIVDCIRPYILEDNSVIIEANPGVGLITSHLLAAGVPEIQTCQKKELLPNFKNLASCNHPRICINLREAFHEWKYEDLSTIGFINCIYKSTLEKKKNGSNDTPKLKTISVEHSPSFFPTVCRHIIHGKWFYYDDVEFYTIVRQDTLNNFLGDTVKQHQKSWVHTVFHLLMNCEKLCELPRTAFLPWAKTDNKTMCLMRIYKKPSAFSIVKREELKDFYTFLQVIGTSRYNYIIPTLERWSPGCGVHLIKGGIPIWKQVVNLSCEEAAYLYKLFQSTPEYENYKEVLHGSPLEAVVEENEEKISENVQSEEISLNVCL